MTFYKNQYQQRKAENPDWYKRHIRRNKKYYRNHFAAWLLSMTKSRAASKKHSRQRQFDLTLDWFEIKLSTGRCEITGLPFDLRKITKKVYAHSPFQPSVDRKDRTKGYTKENCQLVCLIYNMAKGVFAHEDLMKMARALVKEEKS